MDRLAEPRLLRSAIALLAAAVVFGATAVSAAPDPAVGRTAMGLMGDNVYVAPEVQGLVQRDRLEYAARIASRAADGRRIVVAFVEVPDARLNKFREDLFGRLRLARAHGALIVATPTATTMHTSNLTPDAEVAVIRLELISRAHHSFTEKLAELIYDTGLVIHNTTPGSKPRGFGPERNLATFPGRFSDEAKNSNEPPWVLIGLGLAALIVVLSVVGARLVFRAPK